MGSRSWDREEQEFSRKELEPGKGYQEFRKRGKNVLEKNQKTKQPGKQREFGAGPVDF